MLARFKASVEPANRGSIRQPQPNLILIWDITKVCSGSTFLNFVKAYHLLESGSTTLLMDGGERRGQSRLLANLAVKLSQKCRWEICKCRCEGGR